MSPYTGYGKIVEAVQIISQKRISERIIEDCPNASFSASWFGEVRRSPGSWALIKWLRRVSVGLKIHAESSSKGSSRPASDESSTPTAHRISVRGSFEGFLHAELSANVFIERTQVWFFRWMVAGYTLFEFPWAGRLCAPAFEGPSDVDDSWFFVVRSTSRVEFAKRGSFTGEESVSSLNSLLRGLT